ncbi:MAG: hypothetical protein Q7U04_00140 [Bacteriovorax sp.]|nr:hypothetical protein [Bacteriovorax sp.]
MSNSQDDFNPKLLRQYRAEIEELLVESEHVYRLTIDYVLLDEKLEEIFSRAKTDGIEDKIIWNLIHAIIPSYINYVNYKVSGKKAA